jgi:alanine racemase
MFNPSRLEINKSALENNLNFIKKLIGPNVTFSSVVKGNAYGHGIEVFVPLLEACGQNHFSVFSADEALRVLRSSTGQTTVIIMGMISNDAMEWAIMNEIEFFVFELDRLEHAAKTAQQLGKAAKVHIELETGMNRTGFTEKEMAKMANLLQRYNSSLEFKGLCTHFAGAESIANYVRIQKQKERYQQMAERLKTEYQLVPQIQHTACSAAAIRYPETQMDLVRIGILQYGFWPSPETFIEYASDKEDKITPLRRIISWKSEVMSVKEVKTGEFVGYGTSYMAHKDIQVATIPVGYSHGFSRSLSNQGRVLIHGQRMGVIGTVNMNVIVVDVTDLDHVQKGDEVVLIGYQGDAEITVASFSDFSSQVNYELLTRLPESLPRQVIY